MHTEIDRFSHLDSPIHRWDPRWKIATLALLAVSLGIGGEEARQHPTLGRDLPPALASLALSIAVVALSRIPLRAVLRRIRPALWFFGLLIVVLPLTQGDGVPLAGPLTFSPRGLLVAALVTLRAASILFLVVPMLATAPFAETVAALRSLRVPGPIVELIGFSYRYLFVLSDEVRRMQIAWRLRGFEGRRCSLHTLRTIGSGIGMLLVGSMERSQRIYQAMVTRGYAGTLRPARAPEAPRAGDVAKAAATAAAGGALLLWRLA